MGWEPRRVQKVIEPEFVREGAEVKLRRGVATRPLILVDSEVSSGRAAGTATRFLLVSGKPLHEPIARYEPFVMNARQEIEQALDDLRKGTFVR